MKAPRTVPAAVTRRPPQPFRPAPAEKRVTSLLAARLYRARHQSVMPRR